jgi:two-component sensor histidine kinase
MSQTLDFLQVPFALVAVLLNLTLAIIVLARTSRSILYIIFVCICLLVLYWNLVEIMTRITGKVYLSSLGLVASAILPTLMFHFIVVLVRPGRGVSRFVMPSYLLSFILSFASFMALFGSAAKRLVDGYWDIFFFAFFTPFFMGSFAVLASAYKKSTSQEERSRLKYVFAACVVGVMTFFSDHVQTFNLSMPRLGHFGSVFYSSILAIGIFRHRTAYDVLAHMRERLDSLSEIASGIAHELRNPLSSIRGASLLLAGRRGDPQNPANHEYGRIIVEEVDRLETLLASFQNLTRPLRVEKEELSINELLGRVTRLSEVNWLGIAVRLELSPGLPLIRADASSLKQVFLNLMKNAAEACAGEGQILIQTEYLPPFVAIRFTDDGPGIPNEHLGHLFEPFFSTKSGGMGLGLSICRRIVNAHQGGLEAEDISPRGARFTVTLPA